MAEKEKTGFSLWRLFRYGVLIAAIAAIYLGMRTPAPVAARLSTADMQRNLESYQGKIQELERAHASGDYAEVRLSNDELNAILTTSMQQTIQASAASGGSVVLSETPLISMEADQVTSQFRCQVYGHPVMITLRGRLTSLDGYMEFQPTSFKVGDLPMPMGLVEGPLRRKFADPQSGKGMKLPDFISAMDVENGELRMVEK